MITLVEIVLGVAGNAEKCYNGHSTFALTHLSLEDAIQLCRDLEENDPYHSYVVELWTDDVLSIYCKDYWKTGEHPMGHKDKLILSVDRP